MRTMRGAAPAFLTSVLGFWVGIYAIRTFLPTAVWNLSDPLPLALKAAIGIAVHLLGLAGCLLPFVRKRKAMAQLAVAVAAMGVLRQVFLGNDFLGSSLSLLTWVLWLWWLAAFAFNATRMETRLLAAAFATAFALQTGMQAAWHGLDLPTARGITAILCALAINGAFAAVSSIPHDANDVDREDASLAFAAIGAAFFLEMTLLANPGRVSFMSGWQLTHAVLLIQAGLGAAVLLIGNTRNRFVYIAAFAVLIGVAIAAPRIGSERVLLLILAQMATIALLHSAAMHRARSHALAFSAGAIAMFVLIFLFYNRYEWPALWIVAAGLLLIGVPAEAVARAPRRLFYVPLLATVLTLFGYNAREVPAAHESGKILTYNIHQGFDTYGVPAMQLIADEIAKADADVVTLQETGRGWDFLGGADLVAYLRYRFPEYTVTYVPLNGQLWGITMLSRLPAQSDAYGRAFDAPRGSFRYGYVTQRVEFEGSSLRIAGVHLTAGLDGGGETGRIEQMDQLLRAMQGDSNVLIAGDFNAHPDEPPVLHIQAAGYRDAGGLVGLGEKTTWPAHRPVERIDYMFVRGAVQPQSGTIPRTFVSDHLPLLMVFQMRGVLRAATMR